VFAEIMLCQKGIKWRVRNLQKPSNLIGFALDFGHGVKKVPNGGLGPSRNQLFFREFMLPVAMSA
jgi:hypothetical protein